MTGIFSSTITRLKSLLSKYTRSEDVSKVLELKPLTPEYNEVEHGVYVQTLEAALRNPKIRNIALSGSYGVGKSSILQKIADQYQSKVVELSLSTLAPLEAESLGDAVPEQAKTTTNRIQQEIVKQLLYREKPHKTPGSRFRRIEPFGWFRELVFSGFIGFLSLLVFLITGWSASIAAELSSLIIPGFWVHLAVFLFTTILVVVTRRLFYGRVQVRQLSAGTATVTLAQESVSYFDQYLDEIVYFFEVSKRDIVIFEDIDRFEDSYIFETLRSLNTLLNSSSNGNGPIRFIYATKDSIFNVENLLPKRHQEQELESNKSLDPALVEIERANRTKFFDLVIPVVPFITHRSARDLVKKLMDELEHKVSIDVIDLASRYVPDMRLLKNVRNEFIVFRERILSGEGKELKLCESELFAMMLYKNTHLSDFEAIRTGKSKLDLLYEVSRQVVIANIRIIEQEVRVIKSKLAHLDGIERYSQIYGDKLIQLIEQTIRFADFTRQNERITFNGESKAEAELKSQDFWLEFIQCPDEPTISWQNQVYYQGSDKLSFTRSDIAKALNARFDKEYWDSDYRDELMEQLQSQQEKLIFLRSADMKELIARSDFLSNEGESLATFGKKILSDGLAYQLVRAGYISRSFTLYTATYHDGRVSPDAQNFITHHVERYVMDEHYQLAANDVESVIREVGETFLKESSAYNISILDYLLETPGKSEQADLLVGSLARLEVQEKRFLQAYLNGGKNQHKFVERFVRSSSKALVYLIEQVELADEHRLEFVDVALQNLTDKIGYSTTPTLKKYLNENATKFSALTRTELNNDVAATIAEFFYAAEVKVADLRDLTPKLQQHFVNRNRYQINLANLKVALDNPQCFALDSIRDVNEQTYAYMMGNLEAYLAAVRDVSATIASQENFIGLIEDVVVKNQQYISEIIAHAFADCMVSDLSEISENVWSFLAADHRFPATFQNVTSYINAIGAIDEHLSHTLTAEQAVTNCEDVDENEKEELARSILHARKLLPSPALRVNLVESLKLKHFLVARDAPAEKGELFALLLKCQLVEDHYETYTYLFETDWATRERYLQESSDFLSYVTADLLRGDFASILLSEKIQQNIKLSLVKRIDEFTAVLSEEDTLQLAQFALQHGCSLNSNSLKVLAGHKVPAHEVIALLIPLLSSIEQRELFSILDLLGGEYAKLASLGWEQPKIPNSEANRVLLECLEELGIVSSFSLIDGQFKVYKKRKE